MKNNKQPRTDMTPSKKTLPTPMRSPFDDLSTGNGE
jgi:hypothetical protein